MISDPEKITYFAETDFRNKKTRFGIKSKDRSRHIYIIGKTGMGKSTLLENLIIQDIKNGEGVGVLDPHGSLAEKVINFVPEERIKDVVYFAPFDTEYPISFNVMEDVGADKRHLVVSSLMSTFKKIWVDAWSARMEYILNNTLLALLEYPDSTLLGVNRMFSDKDYRKKVVENIADPAVKTFWVDEFAKYNDRYMQEATAAIQNKIGQFTANPLIRNIIGQSKSSFDVRQIMDDKKVLIMNLSKGRIGEQNASLLGGMLITKIYLAAMSRAELTESEIRKKPNFYLFVDEFQSFANDSFADILSEARKYNLALTIAHQYVEQMSENVRAAVFGNVGTTIAFRVGPLDAEILEKIFAPKFTVEDIVNLGFTQVYMTMMIDGVGSPPFSATTLWLFQKPSISFREQIIDNSRKMYTRARDIVDNEIRSWHEFNFAERKPFKERSFDRAPASALLPTSLKLRGTSQTGKQDKPFDKAQTGSPRSYLGQAVSGRQDYRGQAPQRSHYAEQTQNKPYQKQFQRPPQSKMTPVSSHKMEDKTVNQARQVNQVNQAYNQKHSISPKLKDLLQKLVTEEVPKVATEKIEAQKPISTISLSELKESPKKTVISSVKEPSKENVNLLREALKKAMKENTEAQKQKNTAQENIKVQKEVSEDVLRKILE